MSENQQQDVSLTLGDRMNWPFILGQSVMNCQNVLVKIEGEQSEQEVREAVLMLRNLIPNQWVLADEKFKKECEEAVIKVPIDTRLEWCGIRIGKPKFEYDKKVDPHKLLQACVNVFQRRGLLSKTIYIEKMVPEPEDFEEIKDADG